MYEFEQKLQIRLMLINKYKLVLVLRSFKLNQVILDHEKK